MTSSRTSRGSAANCRPTVCLRRRDFSLAAVLNFLANDPDAGKILGTDRGLPSNLDVRKLVADTTTDPNMKQTIAVQTDLGTKFGPNSPSVPPKGHSKVKTELIRIAESVTYGRETPAQGAKDFVTAAKAAIGQS